MMTELKWPGWPELPFLLLFVLIVVLVSVLLVVTAEEEGMQGSQNRVADSVETRSSHGGVVAPHRSAGE